MGIADPGTPIEQALAAVARIGAVPSLLKVLCQTTGMGFAAVARVTDGTWTACAVQDDVGLGLQPGGELAVESTLCREVRAANAPIAFDHASEDAVYAGHPTPKLYGFESYISVPIVLPDGSYFGNLCALDPRPAEVANDRVRSLFTHFAQLIAFELDGQTRTDAIARELVEERAGGALREQFIAVLGHDLRNPLSSIAACAALIRAKQADARTVELSERIGVNVKRIAVLVEDLLDVARGRLGAGMQIRSAPVDDLPAAIEQAIDELRVAHPARELTARIAIEGPVSGDRSRLQQLVSNLLGNALTHGAPAGPITLDASTRADALVIRVHNEGEPIPAEAQSRIFDAYTRHGIAAGPGTGLGLGLYICKQIVLAHGGTLRVDSTATEGTTFTATMPARRGAP